MVLYQLSPWLIGIANGYAKEGLPDSITAPPFVISSMMYAFTLKNAAYLFEKKPVRLGLKMVVRISSLYFIGIMIGRGARYIKENEKNIS
jgi:hypothetical protein